LRKKICLRLKAFLCCCSSKEKDYEEQVEELILDEFNKEITLKRIILRLRLHEFALKDIVNNKQKWKRYKKSARSLLLKLSRDAKT
jgi:hypothetical protein